MLRPSNLPPSIARQTFSKPAAPITGKSASVLLARAAGPSTSPFSEPIGAIVDKTAPKPPTPSKPPPPITGTAAMKNLAQRNAAALRPSDGEEAATDEAKQIAESGDVSGLPGLVEQLLSDRPGAQNHAAKTLEDVLAIKPDLLVGTVDRMVHVVSSEQRRAAQTAALVLPAIARIAPARVARHLPLLTDRFPICSDVGKDGLVGTFAALCTASVAYQKRLESVLEVALSSAEPKTLQRWAEIILPSLKGEPHARARSVVEDRLPTIPRQFAQPIATFLGIKLRPPTP